jgi:hypothetical protein
MNSILGIFYNPLLAYNIDVENVSPVETLAEGSKA